MAFQFSTLSPREQKMLGLLFIFGSIVGIGYFCIFPTWKHLTEQFNKTQALNTEIQQLTSQEQSAIATLNQYRKSVEIPQDVTVREFHPNTFEQNVKSMLDQLTNLATQTGNDMISLIPVTDPTALASPAITPTSGNTPGSVGGAAAFTNTNQPGNAANSPTSLQSATTLQNTSPPMQNASAPATAENTLRKFVFDLSIRGSYSNILSFLQSLNHYHELIEVSSITIENEGGPMRNNTPPDQSQRIDPLKPIKITSRLVLYLKPSS